ncbi:MAG: MEDS domain-containing protein [Candidatus Eisenbacteria bacterium]|nr:MEDS domain-containing protein [Candidatus Eisenbacteria bacterium]
MDHAPAQRAPGHPGPGDHLCCLYESESDFRAMLVPYVRRGLEAGQKVVYVLDDRTRESRLRHLLDEDGVAVEHYLSTGQLAILVHSDVYVRDGAFDPERMIALLRAEVDRARSESYPALRATGEMTWSRRGIPGSERLIEYEARLNDVVPSIPLIANCQYDCRRFPHAQLLDVLHTHPLAQVDGEPVANPYYVPPRDFLGVNREAGLLRHRIRALREMGAEGK